MAVVSETPFMDVDIDALTLSAIVQMQLEEGEELASKAKNKQREGTLSDAQLALQMYMDDLKCADATLKDRKLAQSISIAVQRDGDLIYEAYRQERQAEKDRAMALRMMNGQSPTTPGDAVEHAYEEEQKDTQDPWANTEMLAKMAAMYIDPSASTAELDDDNSDNESVHHAESSTWAASRGSQNSPLRDCIACGDAKKREEVARVPCDHEYCRPCLEELFRLSMKDETLFPPRCDHQEIPLSLVRVFLPSDLAKEYEAKYEELSTKNRTYCHDRTCQAFISTKANEEIVTCPKCSKTTCTICKNPSHSGDCPEDTALQQLLDTANANQWQRCYGCNRLVELKHGCNHMSCPCGAQFCYVCGARWHTCGCPQWDEGRLIARAAQIIDRDPRRRFFQPQRVDHAQPTTHSSTASIDASRIASSLPRQFSIPQSRATALNAAIANLRENHNCGHDRWKFIKGRHHCEECGHLLKESIFECRQCSLMACNRCRRNRL